MRFSNSACHLSCQFPTPNLVLCADSKDRKILCKKCLSSYGNTSFWCEIPPNSCTKCSHCADLHHACKLVSFPCHWYLKWGNKMGVDIWNKGTLSILSSQFQKIVKSDFLCMWLTMLQAAKTSEMLKIVHLQCTIWGQNEADLGTSSQHCWLDSLVTSYCK